MSLEQVNASEIAEYKSMYLQKQVGAHSWWDITARLKDGRTIHGIEFSNGQTEIVTIAQVENGTDLAQPKEKAG